GNHMMADTVAGNSSASAQSCESVKRSCRDRKTFKYYVRKRISDKRTKNQAKTDKTEHGMEKRGEAKVNKGQSCQPLKVIHYKD
ncbi:hypothetical protein Tco_1512602, partial [Tanacetum coccineum]